MAKQNLLTIIFLFLGASAFSQIWTTSGVPFYFGEAASSADGTKLIVVGFSDVYTSTNSGGEWTSNGLPQEMWVASSADGNTLLTTAYGFGPVYFSTNAGSTWMTNTPPADMGFQPNFFSVASSADGSILAVAGTGGQIYYTTNHGASWQWNDTEAPGSKLAFSSDGTKWFCAGYVSTNIYASTNYGNSWGKTGCPTNDILNLASSADGTKLIVGTEGPIFISTNAGMNWTPTPTPFSPSTAWYWVAISADGTKLIGASRGSGLAGPVYTSTNSGITWVSNNITSHIWGGVASSADGGTLVVSGGGYVFTSHTVFSPALALTTPSNTLTLSWIVPSTNFVLEQSSNLSTTNWMIITNKPLLDFANLQYQVLMSPTNPGCFYRLKTP